MKDSIEPFSKVEATGTEHGRMGRGEECQSPLSSQELLQKGAFGLRNSRRELRAG